MKTKLIVPWLWIAILIAISASWFLLGMTACERSHRKRGVQVTSEDLDNLSRAFFRLGVSTAALVITEHKARGEDIPPPKELLRECVRHDTILSGGNTPLKVELPDP